MISQCTYLYAHSILCHWIRLVDIINIPNNISLTALKADSQSEILPKWWKFYTSAACDKYHVLKHARYPKDPLLPQGTTPLNRKLFNVYFAF